MAVVPVSQPAVAPTPLPAPQDSTTAPLSAFGAAQANALQKGAGDIAAASDTLSSIAMTRMQQANAVGRAHDAGNAAVANQQDLETLVNKGGMADPNAVSGYAQTVSDRNAQLVAAHAQQYGQSSANQLSAILEEKKS